MATATFNQKCELNSEEKQAVETHAQDMFKRNAVESYLSLGKKDVCIKRKHDDPKVLEVFEMSDTLERNNDLVTKFNKRNK